MLNNSFIVSSNELVFTKLLNAVSNGIIVLFKEPDSTRLFLTDEANLS